MTSLRQTAESRSGRRCKAAGERSSDSVPGRTGRPHRNTAVPACKNQQKTSQWGIHAQAAFRREGRQHIPGGGWQMEQPGSPTACFTSTHNNLLPVCASGAAEQTQHCELTPRASCTLEWCGLKDKDTNRQKGLNCRIPAVFHKVGWVG